MTLKDITFFLGIALLVGTADSGLHAELGSNSNFAVKSNESQATFNLIQEAFAAEPDLPEKEKEKLTQKLFEKYKKIDQALPNNWGNLPTNLRVERLFSLMHQELLHGKYLEASSLLSTTINTGNFNCVSATLLFQSLAERYHLPIVSVQTQGHVWSRCLTGPISEIETTCPNWFQLSESTRSEAPSAKSGSEARILSSQGLIGKIYYNQATLLLEKNQYAAAIEKINLALQWDPSDQSAMDNRLAALNNWAIQLARHGKFQLAHQKLDQVENLNRFYLPLSQNRLYVRQCEISDLCHSGHFDQAVSLLNRQKTHSAENLEIVINTKAAIYDSWLSSPQVAVSQQTKYEILDRALKDLGPERPQYLRLKMKYSQES